MNFASVFIRRPVFATMVVAFLTVMGLLSYRKLGVDLMPNVDLPTVTVSTILRGASPEEVEAQITKPIEDAVNTCSGIDELRSVSREGVSSVTVQFVLERPSAEAIQDVRDKVSAILNRLPDGTEPPVITKFDTDAIPVATLVITGPQSMKELTELADKTVKEGVQSVDGVGQAYLVGGQKRAVNIWLDTGALRARGLTVQQVREALAAQNVEIPSGRVDRQTSEQVLRTMARVSRVEDFNTLVIASRGGVPVTLGEIGQAVDGMEEPRSLSRYDGRNAVSIVVQKQSGTNTVEVVDRLKARLERIERGLPPGVEVQVVRDGSVFIRSSIGEVKLHLVLGAILASIVVLAFMGNWRSTLIASIAIPCSLIATFTVMKALGFTLNNYTLLGLVLAVGIVIDDAIVVLENVYRHMEELGKGAFQAALDGTKEIMLAVVATTSSLVVIFLPLAFMQGRIGRFFFSFGITVAVAVIFSLIIAIVLTPMLCSRFLKPGSMAGHDHEGGTALNRWIHREYARLVRWAMARKRTVLVIAAACIAAVFPLYGLLGKDFQPLDDRGEFNLYVQTPPGSTLTTSDALMRRLEAEIGKLPHVRHMLTTLGDTGSGNADVTQCNLFVSMDPLGERKLSQFQVMAMARKVLQAMPELRGAVQPVGDWGGGGGQYQFSYAIQGPDLVKLDELSQRVMARLRTEPGFVDVDTNQAARKPEVQVAIDRAKAADLGVRATDIANALRYLVAGERVGKFREGAEQYDVWIQARPEDRAQESALYQIEVPSAQGTTVPLANLVRLQDDMGPGQINRINRLRQMTVVANLVDLPVGTALEKAQAIAREADLPPGYQTFALGRARSFNETYQNFAIAFALSFIFMYMILAAQFESFLHPVTILLALPLAVPFALVSLLLLRESLNIYSIIGLFMLLGIVKKNGILQVDYTNTLRASGLARDEAIFKANLVRLRPILMTTVTLIAGMIPIALGQGPGSSSRASMAKVIIGGQALSLVITLLIVPVAYALFDDAGAFFRSELPAGLRARQRWALAFAASGAALGLWLLLQGTGFFVTLGPVAAWIAHGLLALGAAALILGAWLHHRHGLSAPAEGVTGG